MVIGFPRFLAALALPLLAVCLSVPLVRGQELLAEPSADEIEFFETSIRPLLAKRCYGCHSRQASPPKGGLQLDLRESVLQGGESGPLLDRDQLDQSLLLLAVRRHDDASPMPPDAPLPQAEVALLEAWVARGAPMPLKISAKSDASAHWAFQPPRVAPLPEVREGSASWPWDAYVLSRLEQAGLQAGSPAAPHALARRLWFDLTGLPPAYEDVRHFIEDGSPDAYERLVDRLLLSPRFGERWARLWLDVARYADTKGYVFTEDRSFPNAYRYRQWVIESFNADLPMDQFLRAQIAADRMQDQLGEDARWAMGYLTLGRRFLNNQHDIIDDRIDVVTRGMMGLTVTCARCHDHKYDPIPAQDYYSLYGVFVSSRSPEDAAALWLEDHEKPRNSWVFERGNPGNRGPAAPRRFLRALTGDPAPEFVDGSGRLELADAIVAPGNPLTPRVLVNRVWGELFGNHLVDTPSDFGLRSDAPAQPEVLDYLAVKLVEDGWSFKELIRSIVLSATYRQSSAHREAAWQADPENRLLWRQPRRRLEFEPLRDALLAAGDQLDGGRIGGESADITASPASHRRAVYAFIDRQNLPGLFRTFDFASPDTHAPRRYVTTVPQQSLYLMNSDFAMDAAQALAARVVDARGVDQQVRRLYQLALARDPLPEEAELAEQFLRSTSHETRRPRRAEPAFGRLQQLAQALLQANEFAFLD